MKEKGKRKSEKVAIALLFTFSLLVFTSNAVSISSPRIGTFFDLNGMVPNSVPADRTFGSDDATNMTHRLDPQEQAAVNAVFEAYYERVYYGNAGLSNVWNEANYGPECRGGTGLYRFQFWPDADDGKASFHYEPDTNRVIRTRRLIEYDNLRYLCSVAINEFPSALTHLFRPSWARVAKSGSYYPISASPSWSSTLFDGLTLEHGRPETELPDIAWRSKPSFLLSKDRYFWSNMSLVLSDLQTDYRNDPVNWGYGQGKPCFVAALLDAIDFGDPPSKSDMYTGGYLYFPSTVTNTTMDVVGRGYAVTNVTQETRHWDAVRFTPGSRAQFYSDDDVVMDVVRIGVEEILALNTEPVTNRTVSGRIGVSVPTFLEGMCFYYPDVNDGPYTWVMIDFSIEFDDPDIESGTWYADAGEEDGPPDIRKYTTSYNDEAVVDTPEFSFSCDVDGLGHVTDFRPGIGMYDVLCTISFDYHADVTNVTRNVRLEGLTNETRRLVSDNLAALGLGLSALDRSYCEVAHAIPNVVSNWYGHAERRYSSGLYDAPFGPLVWSDGKWSASLGSDAQVPVLEETEVTDSLNTLGSTYYSDYVVYANPAMLGFSIGTFLDPRANPPSPEFPEEEIVARIEDFGPVPDGNSFWTVSAAYFSPAYGGAVAVDVAMSDHQSSYGETTWVFGPPEAPTNSQLETTAYATTGYAFGHTFPAGTRLDRREGFAPYPGDYTRVDRSDPPVLWTVFSRCGKFGTDRLHQWTEIYNEYGSMRDISYSPASAPETVCEYSSAASSPFTSSASAFAAADSHFLRLANGCSELFESRCGFNFRNPVGMLDFVSAGLNESNTLANVVLGSGTSVEAFVDFGQESGCVGYFLVVGDGFGRVGEIHAMYFEGPDPVEKPFPARLYSISYSLADDTHVKEGHEPGGSDFHGGAVAGRMTSLSRVNWDWKALKRERNKQ